MRRTLLILAGIAMVVIAGFLVMKPNLRMPDESSIPERTARIEQGDMDVWVTGTGNVQPKALAALSFKTQGNVGRIHVQVGEVVQTRVVDINTPCEPVLMLRQAHHDGLPKGSVERSR